MIWLCGIVEIDIFCAANCNFSCTIPALIMSFWRTCGQRYPWLEFHVLLKENTTLRYVVSYFLEKIFIRNFFMSQVMGSVSCNSAAMEKDLARFDVRKREF
jgi:hypothetical protein